MQETDERRESRGTVVTVADLMRRGVVAVTPDASIRELIQILVGNGIDGCPVMERGGKVVGTVSTTDLLWLSDRLVPATPDSPEWNDRARDVLDEKSVRDVMTPDVFGIPPDAGLEELSRFFSRTGLHRALVLEEGELVGIVSISDLLGLVAGRTTAGAPSALDP